MDSEEGHRSFSRPICCPIGQRSKQAPVARRAVSGGRVRARQVAACGLGPLSLIPVRPSRSKAAIKSIRQGNQNVKKYPFKNKQRHTRDAVNKVLPKVLARKVPHHRKSLAPRVVYCLPALLSLVSLLLRLAPRQNAKAAAQHWRRTVVGRLVAGRLPFWVKVVLVARPF